MKIIDKIGKANNKNGFIEKFISFCNRHRIYLIIVILVFTGVFLNKLTNLQSNNDFDHWFDHKETNYKNYSDFVESFGNDQYFILVYRNDSLISRSGIRKIKEISDRIIKLDEVKELVSLNTIKLTVFNQFSIQTQPLIPSGNFNRRQLEGQLSKNEKILKNVLSADRKSTVFHIYQTSDDSADSLYMKLNNIIEASGEGNNFYYYNGKVLSIEATNLAKTESVKFLVLSLIVIFVLLLVIFRNVFYTLIPLIISIISIIITLGIFSAKGGGSGYAQRDNTSDYFSDELYIFSSFP